MRKDWIERLAKGDSVLIDMGSWSPAIQGIVTEVVTVPKFSVLVTADGQDHVFDCNGQQDSIWPQIDAPRLEAFIARN